MGVDAQVSADFFDDLFYGAGFGEVEFEGRVIEAFREFGLQGFLSRILWRLRWIASSTPRMSFSRLAVRFLGFGFGRDVAGEGDGGVGFGVRGGGVDAGGQVGGLIDEGVEDARVMGVVFLSSGGWVEFHGGIGTLSAVEVKRLRWAATKSSKIGRGVAGSLG